jgi:DNA-binding NarL/FixJ family response regulator
MAIKILIADDHQLFREGLVNLLADSSEIEVVAQAEHGRDAIEKAKNYLPHIAILDIGMPIINGIEVTKILKRDLPEIKVIALSMHAGKQYIKGMLEAGACGYLFKNCTYYQLIDAVKTVFDGKKYLSNKITEILINEYLEPEEKIASPRLELTERELEILKLIAEGNTTRNISEKTFISIKTVGTHKQNILEKLHLKTTADLVKFAIKQGIISLD